jgi:hypothetical protein
MCEQLSLLVEELKTNRKSNDILTIPIDNLLDLVYVVVNHCPKRFSSYWLIGLLSIFKFEVVLVGSL